MKSKELETITYHAGNALKTPANVIGEQPVTLTVNNELWLTFMCTPTDLEALTVGFLYNEQIIQSIEDIASIRVCPSEDNVDIWLNRAAQKPEIWIRTSGCSGGKTSVVKNRVQKKGHLHKSKTRLPADKIGDLVKQLNHAQDLYRKSGGVHTSALSDGEKIILIAEDIGRHNTLDKLAGRYILDKISLTTRIILTTGRISSEMIQKAGRIGAVIVISSTSPTTLSVQEAENLGITLIGYARGDRFSVYAHPERILSISMDEKKA